jgi:hypothetical protein
VPIGLGGARERRIRARTLLDEAARRAAETDGVHPRVGEQLGHVREAVRHLDKVRLGVGRVGDSRHVERDAGGRHAPAFELHDRVPRRNDQAEPRTP